MEKTLKEEIEARRDYHKSERGEMHDEEEARVDAELYEKILNLVDDDYEELVNGVSMAETLLEHGIPREELIEAGIFMFKKSCFQYSSEKDANGQTWWSGRTCDGGGAYITHRMNQDKMTPVAVAFEVGHIGAMKEVKDIRHEVDKLEQVAAMRAYNVDLQGIGDDDDNPLEPHE